jgi:tetratricopeptide (TPR) repeat protein
MIDPALPDDPASELRSLLAAGRFREALEAYRGRDAGARPRAEASLLAATAATRLGELPAAEELADRALGEFTGRADADGKMRSVNLIGAIAFEHGRMADAEAAFAQALELARDQHDGLMTARASNNLASVAHLRGNAEMALSLYRQALLEYQRLGDRRGTAETCHNLGLAFRDMGAWSDANGATAEAVRHAEQVGEPTLMALAELGQAELRIEAGEWPLAERGISRAAELSERAGDALGAAEAGRLRARLLLAIGNPASALQEAESAGKVAGEHGSLLLEGECAVLAMQVLESLGRPVEAAARRRRAIEIFTRLGAAAHLSRLSADA